MSARGVLILCGLALLPGRAGLAAQVTEDFTSAVAAGNGATLGQCGQLTVALAGAGGITISGNGVAAISTPSMQDAAILRSTAALPAAGYTVTVKVQNVAYPKGTTENGVTLLTIASAVPSPGSEIDWSTRRLVAVEVDSKPDFVDDSSVFVGYWDSSNTMYTWNGSQWGAGDDAWQPYFAPRSDYTVTVDKTATTYTITVSSGGAQITQASVPVSSVAAASSEYLVVGDRITDFFAGSMDVASVTMPATCSSPLDGGTGFPDAKEFPTPEAGTGWPDGFFIGDSGTSSPTRPTEHSACDCRVGARPGRTGLALLLLLLLVPLARRRRR